MSVLMKRLIVLHILLMLVLCIRAQVFTTSSAGIHVVSTGGSSYTPFSADRPTACMSTTSREMRRILTCPTTLSYAAPSHLHRAPLTGITTMQDDIDAYQRLARTAGPPMRPDAPIGAMPYLFLFILVAGYIFYLHIRKKSSTFAAKF